MSGNDIKKVEPWLWGKDTWLVSRVRYLNPRLRMPHVFHEWGLCTGPDHEKPWSVTMLGEHWKQIMSWVRCLRTQPQEATIHDCHVLQIAYQLGVYFVLNTDPVLAQKTNTMSGFTVERYLQFPELIPHLEQDHKELKYLIQLMGMPLLPLGEIWAKVERVEHDGTIRIYPKGSEWADLERKRIEQEDVIRQREMMTILIGRNPPLHDFQGQLIYDARRRQHMFWDAGTSAQRWWLPPSDTDQERYLKAALEYLKSQDWFKKEQDP